MSFKEVKELRKSGKLEEAINLAQQDLEKEPSNIWNKRSIAWVYHDYLKKYSSIENFDRFVEYLEKLKSLELPEEEKMIFDTCVYQVGKILFALSRVENIDYSKINILFELVTNFHLTKPSESYSFLYKAFHKGYKNWSNYLQFADWWDFSNFRSQDYLSEEFKGKKIMSIVEQAYIAYSKKLLDGEVINKGHAQYFITKLDLLIKNHPEYQYPLYFKAKLLLAIGDNTNMLSAFLPFAKKKRNDFWVWELLADVFPKEDERKFASLCKALSLKSPDDFLINTRQKITSLLIDKKLFNEAKTEIIKILSTRNDNNWRIPQQVQQWTKEQWYKSAISYSDNKGLYNRYSNKAEEILFQDIPEETVAIEFVNNNKNILSFIKDKSKYGFFKYSSFLEKPEIGDHLQVRLQGDGKDGYYKVLTVKKITGEIKSQAIRTFKGKLKLIKPNNFGFADDVFIDPKTIAENNLEDNQEIKGKAILTFKKKKNEWGWKVIGIDKVQ